MNTNVNSYIIRIYDQDLDGIIEYMNTSELYDNLKNNGLEIIKSAHSSFGACFFFEVTGEYTGKLSIQKIDDAPEDFCWDV